MKTRLKEAWCYLHYPAQESAQVDWEWVSGKIPAQDGLLARASKKLTAEQRKSLDNVNTRFRFINGSLNNYTQHAVPGTVNRHARSMVTLLNQVANGLEGIK